MITKRNLKSLEGLLLLILLFKTRSKRQAAAKACISIDTFTKYIAFLEADLGVKLLLGSHNCELTDKAKELVHKIQPIYAGSWLPERKDFNLLNLKNLRSVFYLKAVSIYGNKRNASQTLAASVETINGYIKYLEKTLGLTIMKTDNHGSYPTVSGKKILLEADQLLDMINYLKKIRQLNKDKKIRLALAREIDAAIVTVTDISTKQDIMTFADDPNLHAEDWDIAITYSEPAAADLVTICRYNIPCGFFASREYLNKFGRPKDLDDMQHNHRILDGSSRPYADKKYRNLLQNCDIICPINSVNIILTDMACNGAGICIVPLTIAKDNLVYLDNLPCESTATLYLSVHKDIKDLPLFKVALNKYNDLLNHMPYSDNPGNCQVVN